MRSGTKRVHESVDYVAHRNPSRVRMGIRGGNRFLGQSSGSGTANSSDEGTTSEETSPRVGVGSPDSDRRLVSMLRDVTFSPSDAPNRNGAGPLRSSLLAGVFASAPQGEQGGKVDGDGGKGRSSFAPNDKMLKNSNASRKFLSEQMSVAITEFFTVSHSGGTGKYNCFSIKVSLVDGTSSGARSWFVYRRYSEFRTLHDVLMKRKLGDGAIPALPAKRMFGHFAKDFLEKRRSELEAWLTTILAFKGCMNIPAMRAFLTSNMNRPPQGHRSMGTNSTSSSMDEDARRRMSSAHTSFSSSTGGESDAAFRSGANAFSGSRGSGGSLASDAGAVSIDVAEVKSPAMPVPSKKRSHRSPARPLGAMGQTRTQGLLGRTGNNSPPPSGYDPAAQLQWRRRWIG